MVDADSLRLIEALLGRIESGDLSARQDLFAMIDDRFRRLTRKMLGRFPVVRRWEDTDDVWQNACLRIWRSLERVEFESARHFLNVGALQIRRELLTLAEHYRRPLGEAVLHQSPIRDGRGSIAPPSEFENPTDDVDALRKWTELHEQVEQLQPELREVFNLHWYQDLTLDSIAELLEVSTRTVKRRWQAARLELFHFIDF